MDEKSLSDRVPGVLYDEVQYDEVQDIRQLIELRLDVECAIRSLRELSAFETFGPTLQARIQSIVRRLEGGKDD